MNEMRKEARLYPTVSQPHGGSKIGYSWTHELVAYGLDRYHRKHLRMPTANEIRAGIAELPSYATICKMYGSAGRMFRYHGYRVRRPGWQARRPWDEPTPNAAAPASTNSSA